MVSVVQKAFEGSDGILPVGAIVDTSTWRNESRLHGSRYLRPATEAEVATLRQHDTPRARTSTVPASRPAAKPSGRKRNKE